MEYLTWNSGVTDSDSCSASRSNGELERMTDEELTAIYNEANGLDPKRHNPITTERIFTAMRSAMAVDRQRCAKEIREESARTANPSCRDFETESPSFWAGMEYAADFLRSNDVIQGPRSGPAGIEG